MNLEFTREVIIINGLPVIGTVSVEVEGELDGYDGLFAIDFTCTGFEPETPQAGLLWSAAEGPCDTWLAANKSRVERKALK